MSSALGSPTTYSPLDNSKLAPPPQMELMGGDVDMDEFHAQMDQIGGIQLRSAITDAVVTRTIEGASSFTVSVDDDLQRTIEKSGRLGKPSYVNLNGLWFTLVGINKQRRGQDLKFEEREVNLLRYYNTFIKADRLKFTRAEFVERMIKEVREVNLKYVIPELHDKQPTGDVGIGQVIVDSSGQAIASGTPIGTKQDQLLRGQGIPAVLPGLTVKGEAATAEQIGVVNTVLRTGVSMGANGKVLVTSIMVINTESRATNLPGGDRDSTGAFQQRASQGWPASGDVVTDAREFFKRAIATDKKYPNLSYAMLAQNVQHSGTADGSNYAPWQTEAEKFVNAFGQQAPSSSKGNSTQKNNNQGVAQSVTSGAQFYIRGQVTQVQGSNSSYVLTKENSWDCMQRLANEVNWRCFVVSGVVYFISEAWLFRSKPFMVINEDDAGIDWINYDYDEGKKVATVTVICHLSRWAAPPGSIVRIDGQGSVVDGNYVVNTVTRSIFDTIATITLKKPLPVLPEPTNLPNVPSGFLGSPVIDPSTGNDGRRFGGAGALVQPVPKPYNQGNSGPSTHDTLGLPGYPAFDFFCQPGSPVVACENGKITKLSGHDPDTGWHDAPGEAIGYSMYLLGDSGSVYYYTHLDKRFFGEGDIVDMGQQIATTCKMPGRSAHTHVGVSASSNGYSILDIGNAQIPVAIR